MARPRRTKATSRRTATTTRRRPPREAPTGHLVRSEEHTPLMVVHVTIMPTASSRMIQNIRAAARGPRLQGAATIASAARACSRPTRVRTWAGSGFESARGLCFIADNQRITDDWLDLQMGGMQIG